MNGIAPPGRTLTAALVFIAAATGCATSDRAVAPAEREGRSASTGNPIQVEVRGQTTGSDGLIGKLCRVRFRRDALEMAAHANLDPTIDVVGGKSLYVEGVVEFIGNDAVVLRKGDALSWIPLTNVLMIETVQP